MDAGRPARAAGRLQSWTASRHARNRSARHARPRVAVEPRHRGMCRIFIPATNVVRHRVLSCACFAFMHATTRS